jgi:hypothetical protein
MFTPRRPMCREPGRTEGKHLHVCLPGPVPSCCDLAGVKERLY